MSHPRALGARCHGVLAASQTFFVRVQGAEAEPPNARSGEAAAIGDRALAAPAQGQVKGAVRGAEGRYLHVVQGLGITNKHRLALHVQAAARARSQLGCSFRVFPTQVVCLAAIFTVICLALGVRRPTPFCGAPTATAAAAAGSESGADPASGLIHQSLEDGCCAAPASPPPDSAIQHFGHVDLGTPG